MNIEPHSRAVVQRVTASTVNRTARVIALIGATKGETAKPTDGSPARTGTARNGVAGTHVKSPDPSPSPEQIT